MNFLKDLLKKDITKRLIVLFIIIFFFFILKSMLNLFLLTFIFTYITYSFQKGITDKLDKYIKINPTIITLFLYLILSTAIVFFVSTYIPIIIKQLGEIISEITNFNFDSINIGFLSPYVRKYIHEIDFISIIKGAGLDQILRYASNLGAWGFNVFIASILSLFFLLEKDKIKEFFFKFEDSKISMVYKYTLDFGTNFLNSFGKVVQAQLIIAFVNSILSTIALFLFHFPQVLGLGVMIFIFSLVPVAGTIASLIPLCIIAYTIGGFKTVFYILILIAVLHALESYVLNPRFMADKTELPVFIVFITLLISEHFMGVWGLLLGIPLLMFILDLLNVKLGSAGKKPKEKLLKISLNSLKLKK
ncbi:MULTISPECIES: AI-2E family transporter [Clostridium]|uniref:AI-2E family transporter n=1 Tax=Clostridium cibarium TaxID=2762247 RepID=A0ABR8PRX7_9CLOT|nr:MULTISPECIES: AI-2E family transporter [Clostridium]MBD7910902.1 AI-2E family transporter [Clostridium cibarium]